MSPCAFGYTTCLPLRMFFSAACELVIVCTMLTRSPVTISAFFFLAVNGLFADCSLFFLFFSFFAAYSGSSLTAPSSVYLKYTLCFSGGTYCNGSSSPSSFRMLLMASLTLSVAAVS